MDLAGEVRAGAAECKPERLVALAERMATLLRYAEARALLDLADELGGRSPRMLRARRRLPGYVGDVRADIVNRAARAAGCPPNERRPRWKATPVPGGDSANLEVLARHRLDGVTMIRKTVRAEAPVEVRMYLSDLLGGGRWWRAPRLYHAEQDRPDRWHLFLEDLGDLARVTTADDLVTASRALGELNIRPLDQATLARSPWLVVEGPPRFVRQAWPASRLPGFIDAHLHRRVVDVLTDLVAQEERLLEQLAALPIVLCHGDANVANIIRRGDGIVLIDWNMARLAPVGRDLAILLGRPNEAARDEPRLVEACLDAYVEGLNTEPSRTFARAEVEYGFRYRLVAHLVRQEMVRLPKPADAARDDPIDRRTRAANLERFCREAQTLLRSLP